MEGLVRGIWRLPAAEADRMLREGVYVKKKYSHRDKSERPLGQRGVGFRAHELCEVEVVVLGSPSLIVLMVSVDVKQHGTEHKTVHCAMHVTFLAESRYGIPCTQFFVGLGASGETEAEECKLWSAFTCVSFWMTRAVVWPFRK